MKKLLIIGLALGAVVAFVGADVVGTAVEGARNSIRSALTEDVPLETRLAEAQARIDAYAENIIDGEVAAASMKDMIADTRREVRGLRARAAHERETLVAMRETLVAMRETLGAGATDSDAMLATSYAEGASADKAAARAALVHVRAFRSANTMLARREADLERLETQYADTLAALEKARAERARLSEEARVLEVEIQSMNARRAAAQTRRAVGEDSISSSGHAEAEEALTGIRSEIRRQNKLLEYYETRYEVERSDAYADAGALPEAGDPAQAIEEALASWPEDR